MKDKIVQSLLGWIGVFSWKEVDRRASALMDFEICECQDSFKIPIESIDNNIVGQLVLIKASQFSDVYTIEDLSWRIESEMRESCISKVLKVNSLIRLAEDASLV